MRGIVAGLAMGCLSIGLTSCGEAKSPLASAEAGSAVDLQVVDLQEQEDLGAVPGYDPQATDEARKTLDLPALKVDPCQFAGTDKIFPILQSQITKVFPLRQGSVTLSEPRLKSVICAPLKIAMSARVRYKPSSLLPTLKGTLQLESPVVANVVPGSGDQKVQSATACMNAVKVTKIDMKYVPSIVDKAIKYLVNRKLPSNVCADVTALATTFVASGRQLAPIGTTSPAESVGTVAPAESVGAVQVGTEVRRPRPPIGSPVQTGGTTRDHRSASTP